MNRTNIQFAHTATRFSYPTGFSNDQCSLLADIIDWLNEECFENESWEGEDRYRVFDSGDEQVFRKIEELCRTEDASFYWGLTGEGKYRVGVVKSSPLTLKSRNVQNQKN
jgi:hypothetical protein